MMDDGMLSVDGDEGGIKSKEVVIQQPQMHSPQKDSNFDVSQHAPQSKTAIGNYKSPSGLKSIQKLESTD
jgi:hypothetical protein